MGMGTAMRKDAAKDAAASEALDLLKEENYQTAVSGYDVEAQVPEAVGEPESLSLSPQA